ncbi:unnamed protein product [Pylaiella littoralis]
MSSRHGSFLGTGSNTSSSSNNSSGERRRRRAGTVTLVTVFEAETGRRLDVELSEGGHDGGGATEALRRKLFGLTGVPVENQILLCGGPPYKPLRSQLPPASITVTVTNSDATAAAAATTAVPGSLSSTSTTAANTTTTTTTKIFLFDWRTLAPEQQQQQPHSSSPSMVSNTRSSASYSKSISLPHGSSGSAAAASSSPLVGGGGGGENPSSLSTPSAAPDAAAAAAAAAATGVDVAAAAATAADEELAVAAEAAEFVGPAEVFLPTAETARPPPSPLPPIEPAEGSAVLLKNIANYERGSMLELNRGEVYLETTRRRLQGGEACADRMQTMVDALNAAVSNSLDHWEPLQLAYGGLKERLAEQASRHEGMLQTFEQDVATLGTVPLHPALVDAAAAAAASSTNASSLSSSGSGRQNRGGAGPSPSSPAAFSSGGRTDAASDQAAAAAAAVSSSASSSSLGGGPAASAASGGGRGGTATASGGVGGGSLLSQRPEEEDTGGSGSGRGKTLLDCIPLEREQRLLESCRTSQRRFRQEGENVAQKYATIERGIQEQRGDPVTASDAVQELLERIRQLCREQESKSAELEVNYSKSFNLAKENWTNDDDKRKSGAISGLTELMIAQGRIVPIMKRNDDQAMAIVVEIARAKAALSSNLRRRLREVSRLQTDIGKIQKHQELVGMAWGQKEEQFEHLGKVARMPAAYEAFLREVSRQRRFHQDFETKVSDFCSSMATLRSAEIVSRETFLRTHLGNLPPVFIEMAPGLRNMPPTFNPGAITPLRPGELPEVYPEAGAEEETEGAESTSEVTGAGAGSSSEGGLKSVGAEGAAVAVVVAKKGGASAATQMQEAAAEVAAAATQTAAAAEPAAVATQTAVVEETRIGTQTEGEERFSTKQGAESGGDGDGGGGGGDCDGGTCNDSGDGGGESSAGVTYTTAESNDASADREERGGGSAVNEAVNGEDTKYHEKSVKSNAALEAENARLVEELAEARTRLEQLRAQAAAVPQGGKAAAEATAGTIGADDGGERIRSFSDVVVRGNVGTAALSTAAARGDERGAARSRGSGSKRGSASSSTSSSKEATQNQLAAYRAGLSMLVKLTDQQRSAVAATAVAAVGAPASSSPAGNPAGENAEVAPAVAVAAEAVPAADEVAMSTSSLSSPTPVVPDNHRHRRDGGDASAPPGTTAVSEMGLACTDDVQGGGGGDVPTGPGTTPPGADAAPSAPAVAVAVDDGQDRALRSEAAAPTEATTACEGEEDRPERAGVASDESAAPSSPVSPGRQEVPSPDGSPPAVEEAAAVAAAVMVAAAARTADAVAGHGAIGAVAVRPATLRIKRAADYVATHLRHNHARVESLLGYEALASVPRISMCSFDVQDIALFLPTMVGGSEGSGGRWVFLAFHVNCPNRYLSEESINTARETLGPSPTYILGKIILVQRHVASDQEPNPYNVAPNTVYYVLTAEKVL